MAGNSPVSATIWIVAPAAFLSIRTRLAKVARCYEAHGLCVSFVGWRRSPNDKATEEDAERAYRHILRGGGYSNSRLPFYYALWMAATFFWAILRRPNRVHALGFETAFPFAVIKMLRRSMYLIYDDADRFSQSFPMSGRVRPIIATLERWTARQSDIHVIPNEHRYPDGLTDHSVVVPNVPSNDSVRAAAAIPIKRTDDGRLVVYVNGWLGAPRGTRVLAEVARRRDILERVHFLAAGRVSDESGRAFAALPNVRYFGLVSNAEALARYRAADVAITLYDPDLPINRFAEANKWGDCVVTGTPFVVNREVLTAARYIDAGMALPVSFGDVDELADLLLRLSEDPATLRAMRTAAGALAAATTGFENEYARVVIDRMSVSA